MAANLQTGPEASPVTALVSGIGHDIQELVKQQVQLFKAEAGEALRKSREASLWLGLGAVLLTLGGILLTLGLVHLLYWLVPSLHLWGSYLIVAAAVGVPGACLAVAGWQRFRSVPLLEQSVKSLEENLEWKTKPT